MLVATQSSKERQMPLKKSGSEEALRNNISEMIRSYRTTGKIGNSKPSSVAKARKQAIAAAFSNQKRYGK